MRQLIEIKSTNSVMRAGTKSSKYNESKTSDKIIRTIDSKLQSEDDNWTVGGENKEGTSDRSSSKHL